MRHVTNQANTQVRHVTNQANTQERHIKKNKKANIQVKDEEKSKFTGNKTKKQVTQMKNVADF